MRIKVRVLIFGLAIGGALSGAPSPSSPPGVPDLPAVPTGPDFPVTVRTPGPAPGVPTGLVDAAGRAVLIDCDVCHSMLPPPPPATLNLESLEDFHRGLRFEHGRLTCLSCHDPADYQGFRLADGTTVERWNVIELCSQCHGPQRTDFDHGAHGGMTGYWDLQRGPRTRNGCTSCHAPHEPAFEPMKPTFKSRDRFLPPGDRHDAGIAVEVSHD